MKAGTMEGLIGASKNIKMVDVPMGVYREAVRKGDTGTMERAMGYAGEFAQKAYDCKDRAEEELRMEMKDEREEQKIKQEEAIEKHREKATDQSEDTVVISEDGKKILSENDVAVDRTPKLQLTDTKLYSSEGKSIEIDTSEVKISVSV